MKIEKRLFLTALVGVSLMTACLFAETRAEKLENCNDMLLETGLGDSELRHAKVKKLSNADKFIICDLMDKDSSVSNKLIAKKLGISVDLLMALYEGNLN